MISCDSEASLQNNFVSKLVSPKLIYPFCEAVRLKVFVSEVKRETFKTDNLPKQLAPGEDTAYLIIISESGDSITRQMNQPGEDQIEVFVQLNKQICIKDFIFVNWE